MVFILISELNLYFITLGCHGFSEADLELKCFINKLEMETKM